MSEIVQTAIVTVVAAGAAWVVVKRVFMTVRPNGQASCDACPSGQKTPPRLTDQPKPLPFIRSR
jgi:hypothetical protein